MRAGQLRHVIELRAPQLVTDAEGSVTDTHGRVKTVRAEARQPSGREIERANVADFRVDTVFRLRYDPELAPSIGLDGGPQSPQQGLSGLWTVRWNGLDHEVEAVLDPDGRRRELILYCTRRASVRHNSAVTAGAA